MKGASYSRNLPDLPTPEPALLAKTWPSEFVRLCIVLALMAKARFAFVSGIVSFRLPLFPGDDMRSLNLFTYEDSIRKTQGSRNRLSKFDEVKKEGLWNPGSVGTRLVSFRLPYLEIQVCDGAVSVLVGYTNFKLGVARILGSIQRSHIVVAPVRRGSPQDGYSVWKATGSAMSAWRWSVNALTNNGVCQRDAQHIPCQADQWFASSDHQSLLPQTFRKRLQGTREQIQCRASTLHGLLRLDWLSHLSSVCAEATYRMGRKPYVRNRAESTTPET